jgi:hypothetical protein
MPLRDHFRPPLDDETQWEGFRAGWPMMIVSHLTRILPRRYVAAPHVHSGAVVETDLPAQDEYSVRVYESKRGRRLVAAVEIVSPANKDRPEHRRVFVAKCLALLHNQVCVAVVDLVTTRNFNLYGDLLASINQNDPSLGPEPPSLYAASCRPRKSGDSWLLEGWAQSLTAGQPLPTLPLWLADNFAVPLDLEASYEETCRILRIG